MSGGFAVNTRRKIVALPTINKPSGGGVTTINLPKTGLLGAIYLRIRANVSGTLSNQNALGFSSIVRRVSLVLNSGIDLYSVSGPGYAYLAQEMVETGFFPVFSGYEGRNPVAADADVVLDQFIPLTINARDPLGMLMLQNEQTLLTLEVDWEADANVATGATVVATATPYLELFTVPRDPQDWPPLNVVMQTLEETRTISGAGEVTYDVPRGNTYLRIGLGLGMGASGADGFSHVKVRLNQSDYLLDTPSAFFDLEYARFHGGRTRTPGTLILDFVGSSGFGNYGMARDLINSGQVTDFGVVLDATGSGTLRVVRQQLVALS